jgi:tryptophan-rich sensory protein
MTHSIVFVAYMLFVIYYSTLLTGHDEYGLGQAALGIIFIVIHIIIGFIHALFLYHKNKKVV